MPSYTTEHYVFTYKEGSLAAKDIRKVAKIQEKCFLPVYIFYKYCVVI